MKETLTRGVLNVLGERVNDCLDVDLRMSAKLKIHGITLIPALDTLQVILILFFASLKIERSFMKHMI